MLFSIQKKGSNLLRLTKRWLLWINILLIWAIAAAFALLSDENILSKNKEIDAFVQVILVVIDPFQSLGKKSQYPEITTLYYSIAWLSCPFWIRLFYVWFVGHIGRSSGGVIFKEKLTIWNRIFLIALLPIWAVLLLGFISNHGGDVRVALLGTSRAQLSLFGMAFPMGFSAIVCLVIFSLKRALNFRNRER